MIQEELDFDKIRNISGSLSEEEARLLFKYAKKSPIPRILEIGSYVGRSACTIAQATDSTIICLDRFPKNFQDWNNQNLIYEDTEREFWKNVRKRGYGEKIITIKEEHSDIMSKMWGHFGLIYIDGNHTVGPVMNDASYAWKTILIGGYLLFHDYDEVVWKDVKLCVDILCKKWGVRILERAGSMVVIQKPKGNIKGNIYKIELEK